MDRGAWQATAHTVSKSDMTENTHTCMWTHTYTYTQLLFTCFIKMQDVFL